MSVAVGSQKEQHKFWLADMDEACIVGLDLLVHWQTTHKLHSTAKCTVRRVRQHRVVAIESEAVSANALSEALKQHWRGAVECIERLEEQWPFRNTSRRQPVACHTWKCPTGYV